MSVWACDSAVVRACVPLRTHRVDPPPPDAAEEQEVDAARTGCLSRGDYLGLPSLAGNQNKPVSSEERLTSDTPSVYSVRLLPPTSPDICVHVLQNVHANVCARYKTAV